MVVQASNTRTQEEKAAESEVQGHPLLPRKWEVRLPYRKPCFNKQQNEKIQAAKVQAWIHKPHVRLKVGRIRPERETAKESQDDRAGRLGEKAVRQEEEQELETGAGEVARCWRALDALVDSVISVF